MRIYVASSWRNTLQPFVVKVLRQYGHLVYDFRNPPDDPWPERMFEGLPAGGFSWGAIDPEWKSWTPAQYRDALRHPLAVAGYRSDRLALDTCDACVLVLPSGRSASWEAGRASLRKRSAVVMFEACEPELMYSDASILVNVEELREWAGRR